MTVDHMYSCHNRQKFTQEIPPQLSSKPKTFSATFIAFLKCTENFERFEKKDNLHSFNISRVIDSEKCGYMNARKLPFQSTL